MTDYGFSWRKKVWKQVYRGVDNYYVFDTTAARGSMSATDLRAIADFLDDLNAEWDKTVQEGLAKCQSSPST